MTRSRPGRLRLFGAAVVASSLLASLLSPLLASPPIAAGAAPVEPAPGPITGGPGTQPPDSYIVVNTDTRRVIAGKDIHTPHLTASTIKVLTALVALERLPISAKIRVSALAAAQPAAKIDMVEGSEWPLDQALASLLMVSANDAAYAIAETAGGSLDGFATAAAGTGKRLGLRDTSFQDPAGLDGREGFGGGTQSSAYDLAIVASNALTIPAITDPTAKVTFEFTDPSGAGRRLVNHNRGFLSGYPGAIGMKTGFTSAANRTLIAAARRDDRTCVAVVLGTWDDTGWASALLDQCFVAEPAPAGAGRIPRNRVATSDARLGALAALPHALGAAGVATAASVPVAGPTEVVIPSGVRAVEADAAPAAAGARSAAGPDPAATAATPSPTSAGSSLGSVLRIAGFVLLALLAGVVMLRRRAVKRQRARRLAWLQAHAEARRRGMIDVVEPDDSEIRLMPTRTAHHVAASSRRHPSDRRVLRPTRPRDHANREGGR